MYNFQFFPLKYNIDFFYKNSYVRYFFFSKRTLSMKLFSANASKSAD